jgi:hypothetical protein
MLCARIETELWLSSLPADTVSDVLGRFGRSARSGVLGRFGRSAQHVPSIGSSVNREKALH